MADQSKVTINIPLQKVLRFYSLRIPSIGAFLLAAIQNIEPRSHSLSRAAGDYTEIHGDTRKYMKIIRTQLAPRIGGLSGFTRISGSILCGTLWKILRTLMTRIKRIKSDITEF